MEEANPFGTIASERQRVGIGRSSASKAARAIAEVSLPAAREREGLGLGYNPLMEQEQAVNGETPFREAARLSVDKPVREIFRCLDGVRSGSDVEALHDMRVATRRLRAVLSVIEPAYQGKPLRRFTSSIAALTDALGAARDTDVFIEFLEGELEKVDAARAYERVGLEAYIEELKGVRKTQQGQLLKEVEHLDEAALRRDAEQVFARDKERAG